MSRDRPSQWQLFSLVSLMTLLWSANFIVAKFTLREIPPLLTAGLRTIISAVLMLPVYHWYTRRNTREHWTRQDIPKLLSLGVLGVGLNQIFFVLGLSLTSVSHAAIIIGLTPVTVLLLAAASGQERLQASRLLGMFIALCGVLVLQLASPGTKASTVVGDIFVFLGSFTFSVYTVRGKTEAHRLGSITVNTFAYGASAIALLPVTLWLGADFRFGSVTWAGWASLLYMAVFASVLCYIIYYYALTHFEASRISAFSYVQPLIATLMAIPMLGEHPTRSLMIGGAIVFVGVFVTERT